MSDTTMIRSLTLRNLLSYGDRAEPIALVPLSVIIGPNGSGKSNVIEAIRLLHAAPADLAAPVIRGGGVREWMRKIPGVSEMSVTADVVYTDLAGALIHDLVLTESADGRLCVSSERISQPADRAAGTTEEVVHYQYSEGYAEIRARNPAFSGPMMSGMGGGPAYNRVPVLDIRADQSILAQRNDSSTYAEVTWLARAYDMMRIYADLGTAPETPARRPQLTDLSEDVLLENGGNLALVLGDLRNQPDAKRTILDRLARFNDRISDITIVVYGGTARLHIEEKGLGKTVPATRISDGTLRFLYLLAVLCHPTPPPLICIEEPELGMHPDAINSVAEMLVEASSRSQVVVTTHSDLLVSALSDHADAVLVCEMTEEGSRMKRLESAKLAKWLEKYSLGDLWLRGQIGGTRW